MDMIERVARAIFASDMRWLPIFEHQFDENKIVYLEAARAAIEAMREHLLNSATRYNEQTYYTAIEDMEYALKAPSPNTQTAETPTGTAAASSNTPPK